MAKSAAAAVHADRGYSQKRRVPQFLVRGPFNSWGFDKGINSQMAQNGDGKWELEIMHTWPTYVQLNVFGYDDFYYGDVDGDEEGDDEGDGAPGNLKAVRRNAEGMKSNNGNSSKKPENLDINEHPFALACGELGFNKNPDRQPREAT